jgi:hypothetical protein
MDHDSTDELLIDCDTCMVRGDACTDCVVSVLLGTPDSLGGVERTALAVLAGSGLVPPLRLVPSTPDRASSAQEGAA